MISEFPLRHGIFLFLATLAATLLSGCDAGTAFGAEEGSRASGVESVSVVAGAGADLVVLEGSRVLLDGHTSRALNGELSLVWSQVEGPTVLLNNPTAMAPEFVAPLAPANLRFRLRAAAEDDIAFDEVAVEVIDAPPPLPILVNGLPDVVAKPGAQDTFVVDLPGSDVPLTLSAHLHCTEGGTVEVDEVVISVQLPKTLPCALLYEATDPDNRQSNRLIRVYWPEGTPLPSTTEVEGPSRLGPGQEGLVRGPESADGHLWSWPAGGAAEGLAESVEGDLVTVMAPAHVGHVVVASERRRNGVFGGPFFSVIEIFAGVGNRAPVADPGPDRAVRPGANFFLKTQGSYDVDRDPLNVVITQTLGPMATPDLSSPGVFTAPEEMDTLLFHVRAFDQTVFSEAQTVRVVVDESATNNSPVVQAQDLRFVIPNKPFTIGPIVASDPDTGFVDSFRISQRADDPVIILATPVEEASVELVSGSAGEVYHFVLAACDEEGLCGEAELEVQVENAGPFVDPVGGSDEDGDGTPANPFASVAGALDVAQRHQLPALRLVVGEHEHFEGELPAGLGLEGGYGLVDDVLVPDQGNSILPTLGTGLVVNDGTLVNLTLRVEGSGTRILAQGESHLTDVTVVEDETHEGPLMAVAEDGIVFGQGLTVVGSANNRFDSTQGENLGVLDLQPQSYLRLSDSQILGGGLADDEGIGLTGRNAIVDLFGSWVEGGSNVADGIGARFWSCDVRLFESGIGGGSDNTRATGLFARDSEVLLDELAGLFGATGGTTTVATAGHLVGPNGMASLSGVIHATEDGVLADQAIGLLLEQPATTIQNATLSAVGDQEADVVALHPGAEVTVAQSEIFADGATARGVSIRDPASGVGEIGLNSVQIQITGRNNAVAVNLIGAQGLYIYGGSVSATALALSGEASGIMGPLYEMSDAQVEVFGGASAAAVTIDGITQPATLVRNSIQASASVGRGRGVVHNYETHLKAVFVNARGAEDTVAVEGLSGQTHVLFSTLTSDDRVLDLAGEVGHEIENSVLHGDRIYRVPASTYRPANWLTVAHDGLVFLEETSSGLVWPLSGTVLSNLGCVDCFTVAYDAAVDATGHLIAGDNPLVDRANPGSPLAYDIDNDARPQGAASDVGADERNDSN
jgi:hypothetical protein